MSEQELKHVIALLLEDAKRLHQLEPNAGTEARIWLAKEPLVLGDGTIKNQIKQDISPYLSRLKELIPALEEIPDSEDKKARFLAELHFIESELK